METEKNEVPTLPTQKIETPQAQPSVESFKNIINESKDALKAEAEAQVKRGRGRPPGAKNTKGRESEAVIPEVMPSAAAGASDLPPIDLKPILKDATKVPFTIAAIKFKNKDIEITDAESETPTFYLNRLLNFHLPELERQDPKKFTLYALMTSFFILFIKKFVVVLEKKKETIEHTHADSQRPDEATHQDTAPKAGPLTEVRATSAVNFFSGKF